MSDKVEPLFMRFEGGVNKKAATLLLDSGASHKFCESSICREAMCSCAT